MQTPEPQRGRSRKVELAVLVGVTVAALIGAGVFAMQPRDHNTSHPSSRPTNPYEVARTKGVQHLLDKWAGALRSGDTKALAALVDPHAAPGFLEQQEQRAKNLAGVPFSDWGFELGNEPDVVLPPDVADSLQASDVWAPAVYLRYGIAGPDAAPTRKPVSLTVARHGDDWKLVSDAPVGGHITWKGPWDFGPLVAKTVPTGTGHNSVVLGHPQDQDEIDALAAELPGAVSAVTEVWGKKWAGDVLVIAAEEQDEFTQLVGDAHNGAEIAAVSVSDAVTPGAATVTGQRVVFSPSADARLTESTRRSVLRHELTHVAARADTVDGSPMWLLEGFADYIGYRKSGESFAQIAPSVAELVERNGPPNSLPADADFSAPDNRSELSYELGWSACSYVAAAFGEPKLLELYHRLARGPVDDKGVDKALQDVIGLHRNDFVARWGHWVAGQAR